MSPILAGLSFITSATWETHLSTSNERKQSIFHCYTEVLKAEHRKFYFLRKYALRATVLVLNIIFQKVKLWNKELCAIL